MSTPRHLRRLVEVAILGSLLLLAAPSTLCLLLTGGLLARLLIVLRRGDCR